jgi:hypothetical protein
MAEDTLFVINFLAILFFLICKNWFKIEEEPLKWSFGIIFIILAIIDLIVLFLYLF